MHAMNGQSQLSLASTANANLLLLFIPESICASTSKLACWSARSAPASTKASPGRRVDARQRKMHCAGGRSKLPSAQRNHPLLAVGYIARQYSAAYYKGGLLFSPDLPFGADLKELEKISKNNKSKGEGFALDLFRGGG
jgi:hypothetical protein